MSQAPLSRRCLRLRRLLWLSSGLVFGPSQWALAIRMGLGMEWQMGVAAASVAVGVLRCAAKKT